MRNFDYEKLSSRTWDSEILSYGGCFKTTPNEIDAVMANGEKTVLFKPLEPYETPDAIAMICESYQETLNKEQILSHQYLLAKM